MARGFHPIGFRTRVPNLLRFRGGVYGVYVVAAAHRANPGVDTYIRESGCGGAAGVAPRGGSTDVAARDGDHCNSGCNCLDSKR